MKDCSTSQRQQGRFYRVLPVSTGVHWAWRYRLDVSEQNPLSAIDLLRSGNATEKTKTSGEVTLTFNHILSKLTLD